MKDLGLMKGDTEAAVAEGAHALFFPHGLGHAIGLDVHDMEDLGEDLVGYTDDIKRSPQFGLRSLRFGRPLAKGHVMTVEPGIYFIPELIDRWSSEGKFKNYINYSKLKSYRNFGGIRIEDNILITRLRRFERKPCSMEFILYNYRAQRDSYTHYSLDALRSTSSWIKIRVKFTD